MNSLKIFYYFVTIFISVCNGSSKRVPVWSTYYSVSGNLHLPYTELQEPFSAWYDGDEQRSRIDYYQGTVKTYQLGKEGHYGTTLEVVPVTTESFANKPTCIKSDGSDSAPVAPQSILPNTTNFKFVGTEIKNGYQCEIWREVDINFERRSTYTIWIRWQKNPRLPSLSQPIPVRYEMKGYNTLLGSHYDHYYLDYDSYLIEKPSAELFHVEESITCNGLDGSNDHQNYNVNPMNEFINRHTTHVDQAWEEYKITHSKSYVNSMEHDERKEIFRNNLRHIHSSNRKGLGFTLKVNHLADMSDAELKLLRGGVFKHGYNGGDAFPYTSNQINKLSADLPKNFDWRIHGAVTPVKDQATCGSCWSFSSVGAMEGAYFLKTGHLIRFSEQALVDCTWGFGNNGCDGGSHLSSFQWIKKHGGIPSDEQYGYYLGQDGYCHTELTNLLAPITGFVNVSSGDESALKVALFKHGPISVFIDASHKSFSFYSSGVYYEPECKSDENDLDHVVLLIGYGTLKGENYWLIKNSWSNHWGDQGYVLMSTKNNNCGVMTIPMYVTM